jgi:phosphoribosylaminoimidazole carboxylase PurE protein
MSNNPAVAVVMGSISDRPVADKAVAVLKELGIGVEVRVLSAHRTPEELAEFASGAAGRGVRVVIAFAGMSAALSGAVAAHTALPVIGVPVASGALAGADALLATSQMPPGVPVACMAIGEPGAANAAVFAAEILALSDGAVAKNLAAYRKKRKSKVLDADREVRE